MGRKSKARWRFTQTRSLEGRLTLNLVWWVVVNIGHRTPDKYQLLGQVGAIASSGSSPIIAISGPTEWHIEMALISGAHAIIVPECETKEQAETLVRACKYPSARWPKGTRHEMVGGALGYTWVGFRQTRKEYLHSANDNVMVCVQIASRRALENVEEIAAVDGVDMLFVGPNDVAAYMGHAPFGHAEIPGVDEAAATARVLKAGLDAGKYVGHFATDADAAAARCKKGFHFVNCGADSIAIERWMSGEMGRLKSLISEDVSGK